MKFITKIEVSDHDEAGHRTDVTFFFEDDSGPWSAREFVPDTPTRNRLNAIEDAITMFNSMEERGELHHEQQE